LKLTIVNYISKKLPINPVFVQSGIWIIIDKKSVKALPS